MIDEMREQQVNKKDSEINHQNRSTTLVWVADTNYTAGGHHVIGDFSVPSVLYTSTTEEVSAETEATEEYFRNLLSSTESANAETINAAIKYRDQFEMDLWRLFDGRWCNLVFKLRAMHATLHNTPRSVMAML